jgi:pilus assembly protein CpaC
MNSLKIKTAGQIASKLFRACMAGTMFAGSVAATWVPTATIAQAADTDLASTEQASTDDGRLVRLGLNKSAVIKLPADAHDVVVGNNEIVDAVLRKKDTIYLFARAVGQTNIFVFDRDGQQILAIDFDVILDTLPLKKLLQRNIAGHQIKIDSVNSNIVLSGKARSAEEARLAVDLAQQFASASSGSLFGGSVAKNVINAMTIMGDNQVMLKVKVVEIQRDVVKQLGVDLQAALSVGEIAFNLATINPFANSLLSPNAGAGVTDNIGNQRFDSIVRAMETDGLSRTLAEPNLTAVSGQPATFFAGGEFPFRTCDASTGAILQCTITFKQFGVKLDFTPTVLNQNRINLKIATEVSEIASVTDGIPALNTRNATTTLDMTSGSAMMIAGLIRENTRQNVAGTPGLKKLPVLGTLFRSRDFMSNETELVVIVTPYLVKPVSEKSLTSPDKNFVPASEREAVFMGKLHKVYDRSGKAPSGHYTGSVGHIVE